MNLETSVKDAMQSFERNKSFKEITKLDAINNLFEEMIAKGLITPPTYDLESISTISTIFQRSEPL